MLLESSFLSLFTNFCNFCSFRKIISFVYFWPNLSIKRGRKGAAAAETQPCDLHSQLLALNSDLQLIFINN
jgi:hypothetical protein